MRCRALALAVVVGLVASPVLGGPERPKLTIGAVLPLSGAQAAFGKEALRGLELAHELLRQTDPELAAGITLLTGDDKSTVSEARTATERLLQKDKAHVLIGSLSAAAVAAVAEVAQAQGRPLVMPTLAPSSALGPTAFPVAFTEPQQGEALAVFATQTLKAKAAAALTDGTGAATSVVTRFKAAFTSGGGQVVLEETYDLASESYTALLGRVKTAGAKVVLLPASASTAGTMITQAGKAGLKATFLGGDTWDGASFARQAHDDAVVLAHFAVDDPAPATKAFVEAFQKKYGRAPGSLAALAFDSFNLVIDALKRAGHNLRDPLVAELGKTKGFQGATGVIDGFGATGEPVKTGVVKDVKNGALVFRTRVSIAAAPAAPAPAPAPAPVAKP